MVATPRTRLLGDNFPSLVYKTPLETVSPCASRWRLGDRRQPLQVEACPARGPCCANKPGLPNRSWDVGSLFLSMPNRRRDKQLVCVCVCVHVVPGSLGCGFGCVRGCRLRGAERDPVYRCACAGAGAVNRAVTHASFGALVPAKVRAARVRMGLLAPQVRYGPHPEKNQNRQAR